MKQDLFNKIETVKNLINKEVESMAQIPEFLAESVNSKKKSTIETLKKVQTKLESELSKIVAVEEKEKREAPIRELMAKMNENAKIQKELKAQLDRAKALAKHDPKDTKSSIEQFKIANQLGEKGRELSHLVEEKNKITESNK